MRRASHSLPLTCFLIMALPNILIYLLRYATQYVTAITDPNDVQALMQVKASIDASTIGATSCVGSWDFSIDPCTSRFAEQFTCGIECAREEKGAWSSSNGTRNIYERITVLQFDNAGYAGVLSPWLGNLTRLRILQLSGNALAGEIPNTIGKLLQLMMLDLSFNSFTGRIPDSIAGLRKLQNLNLAHNKLVGLVPHFLNKLPYLTELRLESNQLSGRFPNLRKLGLLQLIDASDNSLSGRFPRELPSSVYSICLRNNEFDGKLPSIAIADLKQLNVLDLSNNAFAGCVNDAILAHPTLQQLNLSLNKLSQLSIHPKHVSHSPMVALDLSYNMFYGPLPSVFAVMKELSSLSLQYNFFHGVIPPIYGVKATENNENLKPFERLMLDGNFLTGPLPAPFMDMTSDHSAAASFGDNCFQSCPRKFAFCQGKNQKAQTLCRLFNASP